jgi:hypothetical protein
VLAASLEDGSLVLADTVHTVDVRPRRKRMLRYKAVLQSAAEQTGIRGGECAWGARVCSGDRGTFHGLCALWTSRGRERWLGVGF